MKLTLYQIDAFANAAFEGNPAAVVPLDAWLPDGTMQAIAEENNLAETAFFVREAQGYRIRWFTPNKEVKLCGHATLASAYVLFECLGYGEPSLAFESLSGPLAVTRNHDLFTLDFPAQPAEACDAPAALVSGLGKAPVACFANEDFLAVYAHEEDLVQMSPVHESLAQLDRRGVIVTAPGSEYDFVARFFAPKYGIPEDSVTGSAYTQLMPYWADALGKDTLRAKQISPRGGEVYCELRGDRVLISGRAVKYLEGSIEIPL